GRRRPRAGRRGVRAADRRAPQPDADGQASSRGLRSRDPAAGVSDVPVLYIGGWGRSGSTLLAHVLAEVPGFVSVGELRYVWQAGPEANELCGCGLPFDECPVWTAVGQGAVGGGGELDRQEALQPERARL